MLMLPIDFPTLSCLACLVWLLPLPAILLVLCVCSVVSQWLTVSDGLFTEGCGCSMAAEHAENTARTSVCDVTADTCV